jgi:protein-tyrosine phosphatase
MRRILLCTLPAVFGLAVTPALAQQAISTPILTSDENFRDLAGIAARYGGTGFADPTANNGAPACSIAQRC